jgi:glycerol-3-phosphate dehydrogenase (NAD+)
MVPSIAEEDGLVGHANCYNLKAFRSCFEGIRSFAEMHRVCIVGSGNFGSTIAKVIGQNIVNLPDFDSVVRMYVYDELVDGESLVKIINTKHENVKYLPGIALPHNVVAIADLGEAADDCDFYVIVLPHQFLARTLPAMIGKTRPGASGLSLVKGVQMKGEAIELVTEVVEAIVGIPCGSLMGANIANDVAKEDFCESTIAFSDPTIGEKWFPLINNKNFRIKVIKDVYLQQLCGTLKNVVALGGGYVDGLGWGQSTKAAILRIGLEEMYAFALWYYPDKGCDFKTLLESCGVADLIATGYGGRNHKCAVEFAKTGKDFSQIEEELLNGQKLQGTVAAEEVFALLKARNAVKRFPLLATVHLIAIKEIPCSKIVEYDGEHLAKYATE